MNDTINNNASSSSQQQQQRQQQQQQQHPEDSEELLVTSTSSSTTPPNNLQTNAVYPTSSSVIASSSTSPNSSSSSPFSNTNIPIGISTGASPTSSSAIVPVLRPFNQPSETESSGGESGGENSPPLTANLTAGASSSIAISPSTSSASFCQIVSSSTENISPLKISSLVNYDLDSEDEFDEDDEYLEDIQRNQRLHNLQQQQQLQQLQQEQQQKMVNSTNTGSESAEICILPSSSSSSNYEKSKENPSISPQSSNTPPRLGGLITRSSRRKLEIQSLGIPNSSHLGSRNLNILKNQTQPPSIIVKKTSSNTPSSSSSSLIQQQQNFNSSLKTASTSSSAVTAASSSSTSLSSYSSSSINLMKSDNLLNNSSNRLGINNNNEQSQQIDNRLINNINNNNSNNNGTTSCLSGVTNCISSSSNSNSGQNSNNNNTNNNNNSSSSSSTTSSSAKISIKIANKYNCINPNIESQQNSSSAATKSKLNSNEINSSNNAINYINTQSPSTLNSSNNSNDNNVEQRKVEPLKINLNRHDSPIPKITIKPIIKPSSADNNESSSATKTASNTNSSSNSGSSSSSSISCSSNNIPIPKLTIKQTPLPTTIIQNDSNSSTNLTTSNTPQTGTIINPIILSEPHIVPKLTIKTSSSDISGNPVVQSVIVPKLTIKMDSSNSGSTISNSVSGSGNSNNNVLNPNAINRNDHGSSSSRSSSTSPSCSSRSSPSPTQERNNIIKSGGIINKSTTSDLPPLPKLTIKTSGDCVETIISTKSSTTMQHEQQQPECHIVGNALQSTATVPKLTIKTYPKSSSSSSSTIISSCSTPTLNAILTQTDGSVVPKLTIKPILPSLIIEEENEGIIPKLTIKANPSDSATPLYSSELHSAPTVSSKNSNSSGNSGTLSSSKEQQSIPKLKIRTKPITQLPISSVDASNLDGETDDKIPKFSIKHTTTSHLDNSQAIPKLTIHVNESSPNIIYSASSAGSSNNSNSSNSNVSSGTERVVPKLKISLQDKTTTTLDNQPHYYQHHSSTDEISTPGGNSSSGSKTFPKLILKPYPQQQQQQQEPSNVLLKQCLEEDSSSKTIPKLTIVNSGNQITSVISENNDSVNITEKIPKIVIKQASLVTAASASVAAVTNEGSDEIDKSIPKIIMKDIQQFCENENVPQYNNDRSMTKIIHKDLKLEKNRKDIKIKITNPASSSPILEKKLKSQKCKGSSSSNKRLSPTMQFLNTDCSTSQDTNDISVSQHHHNCQPNVKNDFNFAAIHDNQIESIPAKNVTEDHVATNLNRLDDCIQYNSDDLSIKSDEISQILSRQSEQQFSSTVEQQHQPMETVDLTDTPSPGASPNSQHDGIINQDNFNISNRLNNQLLYDILKSAKNEMNAEKNRNASSYSHLLNGQHSSIERNKIDDLLMQNDMTNDSNSFIVNHFNQDQDQNCIDSDIILQNNNTEINKEGHHSSSSSLKRKSDDLFLPETEGNGDCTNEIPYKRTKDNLIGANQIIDTSTTSLSSFEVCLKMTPANCLPNNISDTISLPDSESDNIMLCDTGTNSLDGTKFCTVTDFESIQSIDDEEDIVIIPTENKQQLQPNDGQEEQQQQNLQISLQNNNDVNVDKSREIVDLTEEICSTKESSVIVIQNQNKIMQQEQQSISNLVSAPSSIQLPLNPTKLFNSKQQNYLNAADAAAVATISENLLNHSSNQQIDINFICATNNKNIQDQKINMLVQEDNNDQDSNSNDVPEIENRSRRTPPAVKRGRGRPRKNVTIAKDTTLKRRRTQVSMMLEDALHSQVYKDRSPNVISTEDEIICDDENSRTNQTIESNISSFNLNNDETTMNNEIPIDDNEPEPEPEPEPEAEPEPRTPEKLCSQEDIFQTPHIFATPLEFGSPKSPNNNSNIFSDSFECQGSDGNEETTPNKRGRGRGRGNRGTGRGSRGGRGGRGRGGLRGGRGRPTNTPRRPIGGLTHTPNPNLIRERNFSQDGKARNIFDPLKPSSVQVFEEDTRMSADSSTVPKQSEFLNDENSQSSVLSSTSILEQSVSSVKKRAKFEIIDPDGKTEYPVERIAEYDWPPPKGCCPDRNRETYMIQEQIAEYLGIKSFKRKYPDLYRRQIDMEERNYLRDKGLVTEKMCDLGITAVLAYEALDIMYLDFYDKYEEYKNFLRQKHIKEIETKQKGLSHNNVDKTLQSRDRALQSASKWNTHFNNERKEERQMCIDLQTFVINKPLPKMAAGTIACTGKIYRPADNLVPKKSISLYPIALVPGQFGETYKTYTPEELRSFPINTVTDSPILAAFQKPEIKSEPQETIVSNNVESKIEINDANKVNEDIKDVKDVKPITINEINDSGDSSSSGSESDSDSDSDSDSERSEEDVSPGGIKCTVCHLPQNRNLKGKPEVCIECYTCRKKVHPSCIEMSTNVLNRILSYNWQCSQCKCCIKCKRNANRNKMLFCEQCDRAYHIYCIKIKTIPDKRWSCERCAICRKCGATEPLGNLSSSSSSTSSSAISQLMTSPNSQQLLIKKPNRRAIKWFNEYRIDHLTRLREHANMLCIPCSKLKTLSPPSILDNNNSSSSSNNNSSSLSLLTTATATTATTNLTQTKHGGPTIVNNFIMSPPLSSPSSSSTSSASSKTISVITTSIKGINSNNNSNSNTTTIVTPNNLTTNNNNNLNVTKTSISNS